MVLEYASYRFATADITIDKKRIAMNQRVIQCLMECCFMISSTWSAARAATKDCVKMQLSFFKFQTPVQAGHPNHVHDLIGYIPQGQIAGHFFVSGNDLTQTC